MVLIRAVLLDLDETLYDERGSVLGALQVAAAFAAERFPAVKRETLANVYLEEGNKRWEAFEEEIRVKGRGAQLDPLRVREMCFAQALAAAGAPPSFAPELTRYYGEQRKCRHSLFPEVKKVLEKLKRQAHLALVSNGSSGYQREKLRSTGVEGLFATVVISEEAGYSKPQKAIFERALRDVGVPACEAVMVGDNVEKDIAGAKLCGMRGVLVRRNGDRPRFHNGQVRPDAVIDSLNELAHAITALAGKRVG
ncbi:MAG TPA: HAD family hydrolase [Planctomycetota bacterium]|nr:HAD family hydrolase [Planctomycetota bacterium]